MISGTELFLGLFHNLAIFIVLVAVYGYLLRHFNTTNLVARQALTGFVFGLFAIGCMYIKIPVAPGVIVDQRNAVVALSGAFGGPLSAVISAFMAALNRAYLGGAGIYGGIIGIGLAAVAGILFYLNQEKINTIFKATLSAIAATIIILPGFLFFKDLQTGWALLKAMALPYGGAAFVGLLFVGLLLAYERNRYFSEVKRRESEKRYRELFENIIDVYYRADQDGRILLMSPSAERIFGYSREELTGKRLANFFKDPSVREVFVAQIKKHGRVENFEAELRRKDGTFAWISTNAKILTDDEGNYIGVEGITRDITRLKDSEKEKNHLEEQLRQSQKMEAIGTLAGGIAHDFNNILAGIIGYAELTLHDAANHKVAHEDIQKILDGAMRARDLVQQILAFSRKMEIKMVSLDLNEIVSSAMSLLERTLPRMIKLKLNLDQNLRLVNGDTTQIEQVILNLANNAADAMPEGGKLVIETKNVTLDEEYAGSQAEVMAGDYVMMSVTDTGQGMERWVVERIFEPFYTTKELGKGTGLGLASAYGIVKKHEGHMTCYSEPGTGTSFKIYFPASQTDLKSKEADIADTARLSSGNETILLADDEENLREFAERLLEKNGYQVMTAATGEQALEIYHSEPSQVDLVILDLGMPGMGGKKALEEIKAHNPKAKVVIASGYSADDTVKDALESGADGFIAKPFLMADMLKAVREALNS